MQYNFEYRFTDILNRVLATSVFKNKCQSKVNNNILSDIVRNVYEMLLQ